MQYLFMFLESHFKKIHTYTHTQTHTLEYASTTHQTNKCD